MGSNIVHITSCTSLFSPNRRISWIEASLGLVVLNLNVVLSWQGISFNICLINGLIVGGPFVIPPFILSYFTFFLLFESTTNDIQGTTDSGFPSRIRSVESISFSNMGSRISSLIKKRMSYENDEVMKSVGVFAITEVIMLCSGSIH